MTLGLFLLGRKAATAGDAKSLGASSSSLLPFFALTQISQMQEEYGLAALF